MSHEEPHPPFPPQSPRRIRISLALKIGIPLLLLLLVLVLLREFGERMAHAEAMVGALEIRVEFPTRLRETMRSSIRVDLHNTGDETIRGAELNFDAAYLGHFGDLSITPAADWPYVIVLPDLPPGDHHRVVVELRAHKVGRKRGLLTVRLPDEAHSGAVALRTLTFP